MKRKNGFTILLTNSKTPEVFNVDNPVQAEGAARGREWRTIPYNPAGVELSTTSSCAPTEHRRDVVCRVSTPSCASLARGYHWFASYGVGWCYLPPLTVASGCCKKTRMRSIRLQRRQTTCYTTVLFATYGGVMVWGSILSAVR